MKLARIECEGLVQYAVVDDAGFRIIEGDIFGTWNASDTIVDAANAKLLAPAVPRQIVAIGLNYKRHAAESGFPMPEAPLVFVKTPNCVIGPGDAIQLPAMAPDEVDYEAELVIVIGKTAKNVCEADAPDYVLGYTCGNDVSARDCQLRLDKQWARGKCFDTFAPLGPWIETDMDPDNARIGIAINDTRMQDSNTSDLIFPCMELVSYLSRCMTLYPGSIIMTGTPEGVGFAQDPKLYLKEGDVVTVDIEGIGTLTNPVTKETQPCSCETSAS